jgi:hypothetical protein
MREKGKPIKSVEEEIGKGSSLLLTLNDEFKKGVQATKQFGGKTNEYCGKVIGNLLKISD